MTRISDLQVTTELLQKHTGIPLYVTHDSSNPFQFKIGINSVLTITSMEVERGGREGVIEHVANFTKRLIHNSSEYKNMVMNVEEKVVEIAELKIQLTEKETIIRTLNEVIASFKTKEEENGESKIEKESDSEEEKVTCV